MRIAALSDFHLGSSARGDAFGHVPSRFGGFLRDLRAEHDQLVLLGDLFQCEHGLLPGGASARRHLARAWRRSAWLREHLMGAEVSQVHGNHDRIRRDVEGVPSTVRLGADGFDVLFLHGHQLDPLLLGTPRLSRTATWISGRCRWLGLGPVARVLEAQDVAIKARRFQIPGGPYERGARELMRAHGVRAVVMGHTHVPWYRELPEGILANAGTCSGGHLQWVSIDTTRAEVTVHVDGRSLSP